MPLLKKCDRLRFQYYEKQNLQRTGTNEYTSCCTGFSVNLNTKFRRHSFNGFGSEIFGGRTQRHDHCITRLFHPYHTSHDSIDDRKTVGLEVDNTDRRRAQCSEQFTGIMTRRNKGTKHILINISEISKSDGRHCLWFPIALFYSCHSRRRMMKIVI
jgi:hypothetical protein